MHNGGYSTNMISDVLFDAVREIESYQRLFPDVYGPVRDQIEQCKAGMTKLRRQLDQPPGTDDVCSPSALVDANLDRAR
jgi:hypothetical protein